MNKIVFILAILLFWLQYKIWLQDGGVPEVILLQKEVTVLKLQVQKLEERNMSLDAEVNDLKTGLDAIEERARSELGMIKKGEVYYQVIEKKTTTKQSNADKNKLKIKNKHLIEKPVLE